MAGPRLLTQPEAPPSAAEESTSWFEKQFRTQNAALREKFLKDVEAKRRGVTEDKYRIGEVMAELIGPAEHRNRELVTKQESYERILLEERTAAATLAYEERADRLRIWFLKAQTAQKWEADKRAQRKEVAQKDPWEDNDGLPKMDSPP